LISLGFIIVQPAAMPIGIDPKVDFAFKMVFGNPQHTRITIHFLNAVLSPPRPIDWVEILNPILDKNRSDDKLVILDVLARDTGGHQFNIEMQTTLPMDLPKRLTYYNCLNYVRQLGEGSPYLDLRPTISICVLDRALFQEAPEYHLSFRIRCDQRALVFSNDLQFHLLELPKFQPVSDTVGKLPTLERWLYFLQHAEELEADELSRMLVEPEYVEATEVLAMISRSPDDRQFYEARQKFLHDEEAKLFAAREEGREEGRAQGATIGKIQLLQQLLGDKEQATSELLKLDEAGLSSLLAALQARLRTRHS
jgi:predicted transposase/invertase (TIGR01784 family)